MSGFEELKRSLRSAQGVCSVSDAQGRGKFFICPLDISSISLTDIIAPFLSIIRSPLSTGPITSAALSALHSFFSCGLFLKSDPSVDVALAAVSSSVSHCKFEASDSSGDEVVLLRILTVIEDCMCGVWGTRLGDIEVCEMLETVLATCVQMRLSGSSFGIISRCNSVHITTTEALRRSAELTMHKLVRIVLSKLHILDPVSEEKRLMAVPSAPSAGTDPSSPTQSVEPVSGDSVAASQSQTPIAESPQDASTTQKLDCMCGTAYQLFGLTLMCTSDGLPSIVELLRVLVNILDPHDRIHTDSTRLLALGVLNTSFEVSGPRLGDFPTLRTMILDHGCKYLFQLAQSDNSSIFQLTLRTISTMINSVRRYLKLQQELFLAYTLDRLAPPVTGKPSRLGTPVPKSGLFSPRPSSPGSHASSLELLEEADIENGSPTPNKPSVIPASGGARDLLLDVLSQISSHPSFLVELFSNYDCDTNAENLFDRMIDLLTKVH